jgi:hypothetical protein
MTFKLNRVAATEFPPRLQKLFNKAFGQIEAQINEILDVQAATDAANAAAVAANTAAVAAQTTADDITASNALGTSYVTGLTLSATDAGTDATITISGHTRHYPQPDGSTVDVAVTGGSLTGRSYDTSYYIYYDDPSRAGGAVSYQSTTSEGTAAQIGDRHTVGGVTTPAAADPDTSGEGTKPPGPGSFRFPTP